MSAPREPAIEVLDAIVAGLRARARSIRDSAIESGVTVIDGPPMTIIRTSEATQRLQIARDLEDLANSLEGGRS